MTPATIFGREPSGMIKIKKKILHWHMATITNIYSYIPFCKKKNDWMY